MARLLLYPVCIICLSSHLNMKHPNVEGFDPDCVHCVSRWVRPVGARNMCEQRVQRNSRTDLLQLQSNSNSNINSSSISSSFDFATVCMYKVLYFIMFHYHIGTIV